MIKNNYTIVFGNQLCARFHKNKNSILITRVTASKYVVAPAELLKKKVPSFRKRVSSSTSVEAILASKFSLESTQSMYAGTNSLT